MCRKNIYTWHWVSCDIRRFARLNCLIHIILPAAIGKAEAAGLTTFIAYSDVKERNVVYTALRNMAVNSELKTILKIVITYFSCYDIQGLFTKLICMRLVLKRLNSPASRLYTVPYIQVQIKENIKAPRHWLLCGEFTRTGEFPAQMPSNAENFSIWWRHHDISVGSSYLTMPTSTAVSLNHHRSQDIAE